MVSEDVGIKLDEVTTDMLGTCKATEVSKEATTTLDGAGDREALCKRTDLLRSTTCTTTPDYEGEKLQAAAGLRVCCARAALLRLRTNGRDCRVRVDCNIQVPPRAMLPSQHKPQNTEPHSAPFTSLQPNPKGLL